MKNLKLNVQELSIEDQKNIDGGALPLFMAIGLYAGVTSIMATGITGAMYYGYHNNK